VSTPGIDCDECSALRDAFVATVHDVVLLHERHLRAVIEDEPDPHRFELLIHAANEKKQNAKYVYLHHRETHGCSFKQDETNQD
jgi:hypothetical protein